MVVPLYIARVEDLGSGDLVQIKCSCGHVMVLTPRNLARAGVQGNAKVLDLQSRLRCRECDARGRAVVSIRWSKSVA
jgi:hypothetical protein